VVRRIRKLPFLQKKCLNSVKDYRGLLVMLLIQVVALWDGEWDLLQRSQSSEKLVR
jgi:hypothetical protein